MKKLLSFFLSIALLSTLSFTAYATEVAPSVPQEHAIPSIPEEISFSHNRIIKGFTRSASNNLRVMNEYEILQSASAKSDAELLQEGYPWGVSFGLDGAETIFQPDEIVYNDFATVK